MIRRVVLLSALLVLLGFPPMSKADFILVNPGFETGSLGTWFQDQSFSSGQDWSVTTDWPHSGTYAATDVGNKELRQDFAPVSTADVAQVSFWMRHPQGQRIALVNLFYSDGTASSFTVSTQSTGWEFFDVTSRLAPGESLSGIGIFGYFQFGTSADQTFLDDMTVETIAAVPEPPSLLLAVLGLFLGPAVRLASKRPAVLRAGPGPTVYSSEFSGMHS